jgi:hypothetical protein
MVAGLSPFGKLLVFVACPRHAFHARIRFYFILFYFFVLSSNSMMFIIIKKKKISEFCSMAVLSKVCQLSHVSFLVY